MSKPKFKIGDKVRILDGSGIENYTGSFVGGMAALVGQVATVRQVQPFQDGRVACYLSGARGVAGFVWDERGLEPVTEAKEKIVIYREGRSVFAKNLLTGKIAEAKCNPEDQFIFRIGAELAFDRLMGREEKKPEGPKYYNGKVVCAELGLGLFGRPPRWWTVGKIYNVVDGVIFDDDGDRRRAVHSLDELNRATAKYAKFIALVDPKPEEPKPEEPKPEEPKPEEPKCFTGKVVCVESAHPGFWTVGRVYDVRDGVIRDDSHGRRAGAKSPADISRLTDPRTKFIALVE